MSNEPYRVGSALAYLVKRMEMFCGTAGSDVLMYKRNDRSGIPQRMTAVEVLKAQARHYPEHRHLYPLDHQALLDYELSGTLTDTETAATAVEGFLAALSSPSERRSEDLHSRSSRTAQSRSPHASHAIPCVGGNN